MKLHFATIALAFVTPAIAVSDATTATTTAVVSASENFVTVTIGLINSHQNGHVDQDVAIKDMLGDKVICESSDASPLNHHVEWLIDNLKSDIDGNNICRSGMRASDCGDTRKDWSGSGGGAVFSFCATEPDDLKLLCLIGVQGGISPEETGEYIDQIYRTCKGEHRTGGRIFPDGGGEIRLYTMPGLMEDENEA